MESKPKVLVLLSTYNGSKYLKEQLDSIFNQKEVEVSVFASDDISKDDTVAILEEYSKTHNLKYRINERNKNFTYNFLDLMFDCKDLPYDYFAFSDQDDFWLDDKLISGIKALKENEKHFYCSNLLVTDDSLKNQTPMNKFKANDKKHSPYLLENICTGCTMIFDKNFMQKATKYYPNGITLHDYWLFLIAVFTDGFFYDQTGHIYYRQHANNQIGSEKEGAAQYYKNFKNSGRFRTQLFNELLNGYKDEISEEDLNDINTFLTYRKKFGSKFKMLFSHKFRTKHHSILRRVKVLFNKY